MEKDAKIYFERKQIPAILESILTGLTFFQPDDPLSFIEDCCQRIRKGGLLLPEKKHLGWDIFLPVRTTEPQPNPKDSSKKPDLKKKNSIVKRQHSPAGALDGKRLPHIVPSSHGAVNKADSGLFEVVGLPQVKGVAAGIVPKKSVALPPINDAKQRQSAGENRSAAENKTINKESEVEVKELKLMKPDSPIKSWNNVICVLGEIGPEKDSFCQKVADSFGFMYINLFTLLEKESTKDTELGREIQNASVESLSMHIKQSLIRERMEENKSVNGYLINGFPATLDEANSFEIQVTPFSLIFALPTISNPETAAITTAYSDIGKTVVFLSEIEYQSGTLDENKSVMPTITMDVVSEPFKFSQKIPDLVFVLGGPGSGKGTQCAKIVKEFGWAHLSVGDLLRQQVQNQTEIGKMVSDLLREGKIVSSEIVLKLLRDAIELNLSAPGILIDGFPRAMDQAIDFEKSISPCKFVLSFHCPFSTLETRLIERGKTSGRSDDNLETIKKRFETFEKESLPVIEWYESQGKCIKISSEDSVNKVYEETRKHFISRKLPPIVFVLGGPGSGKGTQCAKLIEEFKWTHLSTGDLLRQQVQEQSEIGKELELVMKEGKMVSDDLILKLLKDSIEKNFDNPGILIDGFPRTMNQAVEIEKIIGPCKFILSYHCPFATLQSRLLERGKTSGRADDNIETIKKRFDTFERESLPVIEYFEKSGKCIKVSSEDSVDIVYSNSRKHFFPPIVFVLGGPGSGKGTQCAKIVEKYRWTHLSTGDLLRREVQNETDIGKEAAELMKEGKMVPSELIIRLLREQVYKNLNSPGILIDGFPRTMDQAIEFENKITSSKFVLSFSCQFSTLEARLLERGKTSGRSDDNIETIKKRFETFQTESLPVIEWFDKSGKCRQIASDESVEAVFEKVQMLFS